MPRSRFGRKKIWTDTAALVEHALLALTPHLATLSDGRFHIDARGYRTWGFDYSAKTNPCPKLD
jgi:hypothetical protein